MSKPHRRGPSLGHIMTFSGVPDEKGIRVVSATKTVSAEDGQVIEMRYVWRRKTNAVTTERIVRTTGKDLHVDELPADVLKRMMAKRRKRKD